MAGIGPDGKGETWCERHATLAAEIDGPGGVEVVAGVGAARDKPVQSVFACLEAEAARREANALITGWVDTEYGQAGLSCVRQPASHLVTCKRTSAPLPGQSSERVDSAGNEWRFKLLGVGVSYDLGSPTTRAGARTTDACVDNMCATGGEYRAWARPTPADEPAQPDPECLDECVTSADRRAAPEEGPSAGVQDRSVTVPVPVD